jgi:hypothetical protein
VFRRFVILSLALQLYGSVACAQFHGGIGEGFTIGLTCTDLNNNPQVFVTGAISGDIEVCTNGYATYSVSLITGSANKYFWTVPDGAYIVSGQGSNSIKVQFGINGGDLRVDISSTCQDESVFQAISMVSCPMYLGNQDDGFDLTSGCSDLDGDGATFTIGGIIGTGNFCTGITQVYEADVTSGTPNSFSWNVPNNAIIVSGEGTNTITVLFGEDEGYVSVEISDGCYTVSPSPLYLSNSCALYKGGINDGSSSSIECSDLNGGSSSITGVTIDGPTNFCIYGSETYTAMGTGDITNYFWTVPDGATIVSSNGTNSVLIVFGQYGGNVTVEAANSCEHVTSSIAVSPSACPMFSGGNRAGFALNSTCTSLAGVSEAFTLNSISGPSEYCQDNTETYSISLASGSATTYFWEVPDGTNIIQGQGSSSVLLNLVDAEGDIYCEVKNACFTTTSDAFHVVPVVCGNYSGDGDDGFSNATSCSNLDGISEPLTLNPIVGPNEFCPYGTETYSITPATGGASSYFWIVPDGAIIANGQGTNMVAISFGLNGGNIEVVASDICNSVSSAPLAVVAGGCYVYHGGKNDGSDFSNGCCNLNGTPVALTVSSISGSAQTCVNTTETYTISVLTGAALYYEWTAPDGAIIINGQGTNSVTIQFGMNAGDINVDIVSGCETITATPFAVTMGNCPMYFGANNDGFASEVACVGLNGSSSSFTINDISGDSFICMNGEARFSTSLTSGFVNNYFWEIPSDAFLINGQNTNNITVRFGTSSGIINLTASNGCAEETKSFTVSPMECPQYFGGYDDGFDLISNCGDLNSSGTSFTLNPISGPSAFCAYSTGVYSISLASGTATDFEWTVPADAIITSGQGTDNIAVQFGENNGFVGVTVSYTCENLTAEPIEVVNNCLVYNGGQNDGFIFSSACGSLNGAYTPLTINSIQGSSTFCEQSTESYAISVASGNANIYEWSVPSDAIIIYGQGSPAIMVLFGSLPGNISVDVSNACESILSPSFSVAPTSCNMYYGGINDGLSFEKGCTDLNGTINSFSISDISGPSDFCINGNDFYKVTTSGFASNFYWTVPVGSSIISGQGSPAIIVQFGSIAGNVALVASNNCVSHSPAPLAISPTNCTMYSGGINDGFNLSNHCGDLDGTSSLLTLNPIVGSSAFCKNATESYSISLGTGFANNYNWSVPSGANILSGQGSNSIVVQFGSTDGSIVTVASNSCESAISAPLLVTKGVCQMYSGGKFSGFSSKISSENIYLPITFNSFNGFVRDTMIEIVWSTLSEINSDYFEVEKYMNTGFIAINSTEAAHLSNSLKSYNSIDSTPDAGNNYYRIKEVDFDGMETYSEIFAVTYKKAPSNNSYSGLTIYPNPNDGTHDLNIYLEGLDKFEKTLVSVYNIVGALIWQKVYFSDEDGEIKGIIFENLNQVTKGIYIVHTNSKSQNQSSIFIKM